MPFAAIPFLLIPYDSLTSLFGANVGETSETLPATAVFSVLYLLVRRGRLCFTHDGRRVLQYLLAATVCVGLVTLGNIVLESSGLFDIDIGLRISTSVRQGASLLLGLTSFLMFQDALLRLGLTSACRWTVVGGIPSLVICAVQILQRDYRIQGFSAEPAQLGDMLVLVFLPACFYANLRVGQRLLATAMGGISLLASFSGTAYLKAVIALANRWLVKGHIARGLVVAAGSIAVLYGVLSFYPDNYIFMLAGLFQTFLETGSLVGGSFVDRFFGFIGPLHAFTELHGWFGLGLGGDTVYFDRIFDPGVAQVIRENKYAFPSISSLQAKMLLYGGVIGYLCYLNAWWISWRAAPKSHPAKFLIPTVLAASVFNLGPFFLPYVWLWLAYGSTADKVSGQPAH